MSSTTMRKFAFAWGIVAISLAIVDLVRNGEISPWVSTAWVIAHMFWVGHIILRKIEEKP